MPPLYQQKFATPVSLLPNENSGDTQNKRPSQPHHDTPDPKRRFTSPLPASQDVSRDSSRSPLPHSDWCSNGTTFCYGSVSNLML
ncbi:hypothetical protein HBI24_053520 [Parastagonospora nodorum]|nr:hypothetical protein HBH53_137820 [Parastagonospora nodorum]KAH4306085.1 hypothetical protein HBI01_060610 [Parastagonospora nodorum]KAH4333073.1 hypothetical protein HBI00_049940 [Parastagonospora nodorum]KAH4376817.1 hypothetical protein HBH97_113900 [Parastagonospora nodorum]KAH4377782.1 hypothetical protein HBH94_086210 [Parastagonospora nodorum]